ncbi:MAG: cyanophycin synthetase family protein [Armatimonadota bacterium]
MRIVEILFYGVNKVKLVVEMPDPDRCTTDCNPHVPRGLFNLFPHMARHKCHNGNGYSFKREAMATEVPHLLEHLIIELQAQAQHHEILKGETQWNWRVDPRGTFHVHVEYENELLVLAAIRLAERVVNALDSGQIESIDMTWEMERLKQIADLGRGLRAPAAGARRVPLSLETPLAVGAKGGRTGSRRRKKDAVG